MTSNNKNQSSIVQWLITLGMSNLLTSDDILSGNLLNTILKKTLTTSEYKNQFITPSTAVNKISNWNNLMQIFVILLEYENYKQQTIIKNKHKSYNITKKLNNSWKLKYCLQYYIRNQVILTIDITKIDHRADPKNSKSLLQLFILVIIKNLGLNAKQSVALLSNDSKYLAHILAKGFKQQPKPVLNFLNDILSLLTLIQQFCLNKQNQIFFLKSIKPGLISKFKQISLLSLNILQKFALNSQTSYQIFKIHLISTLMLQYRRHNYLLNQICRTIVNLGKWNKGLIGVLMQNFNNNKELLAVIYDLMMIAEEKGQLNNKNFYSMNKMEQIVNLSIECLADSNLFSIAILIIIKILSTNYELIANPPSSSSADQQKHLMTIITNLQNLGIHKKSHLFTYISSLFTFLYIFGQRKNLIAPFFFKLCVQKYKITINLDQSQFFGMNFLNLLQEFPSIPNTLIVDAISEKYQNYNKGVITQLDIQILSTIVYGNKLGEEQKYKNKNQDSPRAKQILQPDQKTSLKIYNILSKFFFEDVSNSQYITDTIIFIILSNYKSVPIMELTLKMIKVCLAVHFANIRKLNQSKSIVQGVVKLDQSNAFIKRKNLDIEYFLTQIIEMNNKQLNDKIQPLLCYSYIQAESKNKIESNGLKKLIGLLGNVQVLIKKYQEDVKILHQEKRYIKKGPHAISIQKEKQQTTNHNYISSDVINRKKLNPGQNYSLYLSKISRITGDAQKGLEKYQKFRVDKLNKQKIEELKKIQEQQKKLNLQKKYANKILEKGIKIDPKIQNLHQYLYEFNTKENQLLKQKTYDLSTIHLFNPDQEEVNDLEALKYVMKKYNKVLKLYYTIYGGKLRPNSINFFQQIAQKNSLMQVANVWKLFKDHFLDQFMTVKQAQYLVQKLNASKKKKYNDINLLDFQTFQDFIIQASLTMFSRPPKDLSGHSISYLVEQTFYRFRLYATDNKIDSRLFDDENSIQNSNDESTNDLNKKLKQNPDLILPEGYKKITQKKVQFYHLVSIDEFNNSYADVIDILDQILFQKIGFHLIQPFSQLQTKTYAKSLLVKKKQEKNDDFLEKYFTINVKKQLASFSNQDRLIARQIAFVLSQMVESVQLGKKYLASKNMKYSQKQKQEQKKKMLQNQAKLRQKRNKDIKKILEKNKSQNQAKKKQQQQIKSKQEQQKEQQRKKREKYEHDLKKKVQQYQKKKEQQKKKQQDELKKIKQKQIEQFEKKRQQLQKTAKIIQEKKQKQKKEQEQKAKKQQALRRQKSKIRLRNKSLDQSKKKKQAEIDQIIEGSQKIKDNVQKIIKK